jgi:hypothetical protein
MNPQIAQYTSQIQNSGYSLPINRQLFGEFISTEKEHLDFQRKKLRYHE